MNKSILYVVLLVINASFAYADNFTQAVNPKISTAQEVSLLYNLNQPSLPSIPAMDCNYHLPQQVASPDENLMQQWIKNAALQSFTFNYSDIDKQLLALKPCYTEAGWKGFNEALNKSGNNQSIIAQKLMVSAKVTGNINIINTKPNEWKAILPIAVVYQNEKEHFTQAININLVIGRKPSGDLGIMQLIAMTTQSQVK